ncbi:MAG: 30S ribosomal protein S3 [Candidatus Brockarchaeota archaeon]|nr:30S ribosomal protein S3 [Candidatus Brockarchaeota archaeon]
MWRRLVKLSTRKKIIFFKKVLDLGKLHQKIDDFLKEYFKEGGYMGVKILNVPMGLVVTIYTSKPGLVIGPDGRNIRELQDILKEKFNLENPQVNVAEVENPDLEPQLVAQMICRALEKGVKYRRAARVALRRVVAAGAKGCEIRIAGKLATDRARFEKFTYGYMPAAGDPAMKYVKVGKASVLLPQGIIGVKVKILKELVSPDEVQLVEVPQESGEVGEAKGE